MALPTGATYNELDGEEAKHVLLARFEAKLAEIPYLQRHITLPRVRMSLLVQFEIYADQPNPELLGLEDDFLIETNQPIRLVVQDQVSSAPVPGGRPPDQVRDEHGLGTPTMTRGPRETGSHLFHADVSVLDGKVVQEEDGLEIDRTGTGGVAASGLAKMPNATVATLDRGRAGLREGGQRSGLEIFKNSNRR